MWIHFTCFSPSTYDNPSVTCTQQTFHFHICSIDIASCSWRIKILIWRTFSSARMWWSYYFLSLLYSRLRIQFTGTCPGLEMFRYWICWPHVRNVFTCVGTEILLLNFLGKEVKHLISVVRWQYTVSLRMCVCWKRTSSSAFGGNIWCLLEVCVCVCVRACVRARVKVIPK
jgi:hypothetical protein